MSIALSLTRYALFLVGIVTATLSSAAETRQAQTELPRVIVADFSPFPSFEAARATQHLLAEEHDNARLDATIIAYATQELKTHLQQLGLPMSAVSKSSAMPEWTIRLIHRPKGAFDRDPADPSFPISQSHHIAPTARGIEISAESGIGLLYGTYTFLETLGFDWPDPETTRVPSLSEARNRLSKVKDQRWTPAQPYRGFWVYEPSRRDERFLIWMARKKFNIGPTTSPALRKLLGIRGWGGGHHLLEEVFSQPGLFERHPEWFSRIFFLKRRVAAKASLFNPAFSNKQAAYYFADRIAERLESGDLKNVDVLNIWQADSFGRSFDESWSAWWNGNASDNILIFYANVIDRLNALRAKGIVRRPIVVAGASYGQTMVPPYFARNAKRLEGKAYLHLFYPIDRDWSPLGQTVNATPVNRRIIRQISAWKAKANLNFGAVDYFNSSKNGGLALNGYPNFAEDYQQYSAGGLALYAYMHPTSGDPGPRKITHALASRMGWLKNALPADTETRSGLMDEYFQFQFGSSAQTWKSIYSLMSEATSNANEIFGFDSLNFLLIKSIAWTTPFYSDEERNQYIAGFMKGGAQTRPSRFYGRIDFKSTFIGSKESIRMIKSALSRGRAAAQAERNATIKLRMEAEVARIETALKRYQSIQLLSLYTLSPEHATARKAIRATLLRVLQDLETSPHLKGALSPVDHREFIQHYRKVLGASTPASRTHS